MAPKKNAGGGMKGKGRAAKKPAPKTEPKAKTEKQLVIKDATADEVGNQTKTANIVSFVNLYELLRCKLIFYNHFVCGFTYSKEASCCVFAVGQCRRL